MLKNRIFSPVLLHDPSETPLFRCRDQGLLGPVAGAPTERPGSLFETRVSRAPGASDCD